MKKNYHELEVTFEQSVAFLKKWIPRGWWAEVQYHRTWDDISIGAVIRVWRYED